MAVSLVWIHFEKAARIAQHTIPLHNHAYVAKLSGFPTTYLTEFPSILRPVERFFFFFLKKALPLFQQYHVSPVTHGRRCVFFWQPELCSWCTSLECESIPCLVHIVVLKWRDFVDCRTTPKSHTHTPLGPYLKFLNWVVKWCVCL